MTPLSRDPSCMKDLAWRTDLAPEWIEPLVERLLEGDFRLASRGPIVVLDTTDGHRVVLVPRTGRVQIRIGYVVPSEERATAAAAVYERLRSTVTDLSYG